MSKNSKEDKVGKIIDRLHLAHSMAYWKFNMFRSGTSHIIISTYGKLDTDSVTCISPFPKTQQVSLYIKVDLLFISSFHY